MKKNIVIFLFLLSILSTFAFADTFKEDSIINYNIPCINNNAPCTASATCDITILYPNGTMFVNNQAMTNNHPSHLFNITLPSSDVLGTYNSYVYCNDSNVYGSERFEFKINKSGLTDNPFAILGGIIAIVLMSCFYVYSSFKLDDKHIKLKFALYIISFANIIATIIVAKLMNNNYYQINSIMDTAITINVLVGGYIIYKLVHSHIKTIRDGN